MGQTVTLYRTHRSRSLDDVVGQQQVTTLLKRALKEKAVSHAYLFTGPHGVGKTSVARILAHAVNDLPYDTTANDHLDIIEIDAASNRRIDEIRDLREKVHIAPTGSRYKVYIIDEVHMLTKEAFNALLKTLEEPPAHVIFILATTEIHKLPATIISRTQHYSFAPISIEAIVEHIKDVAQKEKIDISPEAQNIVAKASNGSMRDALSMLGQLQSGADSSITADFTREVLGIASQEMAGELILALCAAEAQKVLSLLDTFYAAGISAHAIASQLVQEAQQLFVEQQDASLMAVSRELLTISASRQPNIALRVILLSYCASTAKQSTDTAPAIMPQKTVTSPAKTAIAPPSVAKKAMQAPKKAAAPPAKTEEDTPKAATKVPPVVKKDTESKQQHTAIDDKKWHKLLSFVKEDQTPLYSVLRMARPAKNDQELLLTFQFPFHTKRAKEAKHITAIQKASKKVFGTDLTPVIKTDTAIKVQAPSIETAPPVANGETASILDLMGGGEVVALEESRRE